MIDQFVFPETIKMLSQANHNESTSCVRLVDTNFKTQNKHTNEHVGTITGTSHRVQQVQQPLYQNFYLLVGFIAKLVGKILPTEISSVNCTTSSAHFLHTLSAKKSPHKVTKILAGD